MYTYTFLSNYIFVKNWIFLDKLINYNSKILGARHTVYYTRTGQEATLLIDRIDVPLEKLPPQDIVREVFDVGSNEVQIGGLNTTDPRLKIYKGYNGCLSSEYNNNFSL